MSKKVIAIDQGTTSSRAVLFDEENNLLDFEQKEFKQYFPNDGWVEHDPEELWKSVFDVTDKLIKKHTLKPSDIAGIGITNQRETTVVWDKNSGKAIYPAIVWQDRRTSELCDGLRKETGTEQKIQQKTGLLIDPYFSASRTMLFNIDSNCWDDELLDFLKIPKKILPEVCDSVHDYGDTSLFGGNLKIGGIAGDQQSALIGQCCFSPGEAKSTYGTGCFLLLNTGDKRISSENRLLSTIAYRLDGKTTYGLEGSIFVAGSAVQWLRDELNFFESARDSEEIIDQRNVKSKVLVVPAFTGLGAPHWDPDSRGSIFGLTRDTSIADLTAATLESVAFQTKDLIGAMQNDGANFSELRVDGGMVANNWFSQQLANILNIDVLRPKVIETTALGASYLASMKAGLCPNIESLNSSWVSEKTFCSEKKETNVLQQKYKTWLSAVERTKGLY